MRVVIADTSPINYLILIQEIDLLPRLFGRVVLPSTVQSELSRADAPPTVRQWISLPPDWVDRINTDDVLPFAGLHQGECAAIALATSIPANLLLMDERKGVKVARDRGLYVTGTLGLLELAAQQGLTDLAGSLERLRKTSFRCPKGLLEILLQRNTKHGVDPG